MVAQLPQEAIMYCTNASEIVMNLLRIVSADTVFNDISMSLS